MPSRNTTRLLLAVFVLAFGASTASAQVLFFDTFDNNAAGWTMTGDWAIGATSIGTSVNGVCGLQDPAFDASGDLNGGVAGASIGGPINTGAMIQGPYHLTSPIIDAQGQAKLMLEFMRWLNADYSPLMANTVEVFDGCNWVVIADYGSGGVATQINDNTWVLQQFDITPFANANLQVRFGWEVLLDGAYTDCSGWNVDNVKILNPGALYERFDDNSAGWILSGDWAIGAATAGGVVDVGFSDPDRDADAVFGAGVAGVVLGGNPAQAIVPLTCIESPAVDTTGMTGPSLGFDRFLNSDYLPYMQSSIEVWDGSAWVQIWEQGSISATLLDSTWTHQNFDLSPYSNSALKVRFCYEIGNVNVFNVSSWNIDNVVIFDTGDPLPAGQAATAGGTLDNHAGAAVSRYGNDTSSGDVGPYFVTVFAGGVIILNAKGASGNQPWVLLLGDLSPNANPILPYGQLDIGTPGLGGITVVGSGLDPGFQNALYFTNGSGVGFAGWSIPTYLAGATFTVQAVMVDPAALIVPTNALHICIQ